MTLKFLSFLDKEIRPKINQIKSPYQETMLETLKDANILYFRNFDIDKVDHGDDETEVENLDLPFEKVIFETDAAGFFLVNHMTVKGGRGLVVGFAVHEVEPKIYNMTVVDAIPHEDGGGIRYGLHSYIGKRDGNSDDYKTFLRAFSGILNDLKKKSFASESINERFKLKPKSGTQFLKYKKIVHVFPHKTKTATGILGREIEWSHRWEVAGHWRAIKGLGKNRNGEYVIENFTWVRPHEKGPDKAELIKKTRIIHADSVNS